MKSQAPLPQDKLALIEPRDLIDRFLSDVILPITAYSTPSFEMYKWYQQYCEHLQLGASTPSFFSRHMKKRLQHRRMCGRLEFFCTLKPELATNRE